MSNRKRSASIRKPIHADEIEQMLAGESQLQHSYNSLSHYLRMHRGCTDDHLAPLDGTILHDLWKRGKLKRSNLIAWQLWYRDITRAHGCSGSLAIAYQERVTSSSAGTPKPDRRSDDDEGITARQLYPGSWTYWTAEAANVEEKWGRLRGHEKGLIEQLTRDYYRIEGNKEVHSHDLKYLGKLLSGYNDDRQKIAAGVSRIQGLLDSLAEIYMVPHYYE